MSHNYGPTPTPSTSRPSSTNPTPSTTSTGTPSADSSPGPGLPVTGVLVLPFVVLGVVLLASGALTVFCWFRRRTRWVA